nr:glycine-rich cell wall structural protein 1.8 [Drosophila virilis]
MNGARGRLEREREGERLRESRNEGELPAAPLDKQRECKTDALLCTSNQIYVCCLLATLGVCNATFLSLLGGGGGGGAGGGGSAGGTTYNVIATPTSIGGGGGAHGNGHAYAHGGGGGGGGGGSYSHGHAYGHGGGGGGGGGSAQLIKVILEDGHGYGHGGGVAGGHSYEHGYASGHSHGSYGEQVYKVIEHSAPAAPVAYHANSGGSDYAYGQSYAAGHGYGGGDASYHNQQLKAILPQIIQLVLQEDALYGGGGGGGGGYGNVDAINSQLIDTFGHRGKAIIMRADKAQGAFFKSGHVVQRGTLKVMRVEENQAGGVSNAGWSKGGASGGGGGGGGGGWSSGGSAGGGWSSGGASSGGWSNAQPAGW